MKREVKQFIEKAKRSLAIAKEIFDKGSCDFAVSRAYYSIFYVSEALILSEGKSFAKHSAVMSAIYKDFVAKGWLPKEFHSVLHEAFDLRQRADYLSGEINRETAQKLIDRIERQINIAIEKIEAEP